MTRAALLVPAMRVPATARAAPEGGPPGGIDSRADPRARCVRCRRMPKGTEGSLVAFRFRPAPLTQALSRNCQTGARRPC